MMIVQLLFPVQNSIKKSVNFSISKIELGDTYTQVFSVGEPVIEWEIVFGFLNVNQKTILVDMFSNYDTDVIYEVITYISVNPKRFNLNQWTEIQKSHNSWIVVANFSEVN